MANVLIILVNYRGWRDTIECLESILEQSYQDFQVVIIDNSPDLESFNAIKNWRLAQREFPIGDSQSKSKPVADFVALQENDLSKTSWKQKIVLVHANENAGFSAANNIALKYGMKVGFEFAWLLNNDTVIAPDCLERLVSAMHLDSSLRFGTLGAKIMEYEDRSIVQCAGGGRLHKPVAYSTMIGAGQKDIGQFDVESVKMDFVAGTSMFLRRKFLEDVGLMEERYFLYFEEPDWAIRGTKKGWKMGYCWKAKVYHKGGATTGGKGYSSAIKGSTKFSDFYFQRAKLIFTRKFYWYWLPTVYVSFALVILNRLRRKQFDRVGLLCSLLFDYNKQYPRS